MKNGKPMLSEPTKSETATNSMIESVRLVFTQGTSDKEYRLQVVKEASGFLVNFQYGRRNGTLKSGTKTVAPVSLEEATKIYNKKLKEQLSEGYLVDGECTSTVSPVEKEMSGTVPQLLNLITESELNVLIDDPDFGFEQKHDGERRLVFKSTKNVCYGGNKKGIKISIPSEVESSLPKAELEIDGELVGSILFVFDLMKYKGVDYKKESYSKRREILATIKFGSNIIVSETARTAKEKRELIAKLREEGAEGVVAKDMRAPYTSSRPSSGGVALKFKFYKTATVKVSALTKGKRSIQTSVLESGKFKDVGAVTIPPNKDMPKVGDLVEVRYLYAYKGGSLFQPTYLGVRTDQDDSDADGSQLEYKQELASV